MMGSMLKGEKDLLTIQIHCDGPVRGLTITADANANVKGAALEPQVMLPPNACGSFTKTVKSYSLIQLSLS